MAFYSRSFTKYLRLQTKEVKTPDLILGGGAPICLLQTRGEEEREIRFVSRNTSKDPLLSRAQIIREKDLEKAISKSGEEINLLFISRAGLAKPEHILEAVKNSHLDSLVFSFAVDARIEFLHRLRFFVKTRREKNAVKSPVLFRLKEDEDFDKKIVILSALLEDGIGDGILYTGEKEASLDTLRLFLERYNQRRKERDYTEDDPAVFPAYDPFVFQKRESGKVLFVGGKEKPILIADYSESELSKEALAGIGYSFDGETGQWKKEEDAADFIYTSQKYLPFKAPEGLHVLVDAQIYENVPDKKVYYPLFTFGTWMLRLDSRAEELNFISIDCKQITEGQWAELLKEEDATRVFCLFASGGSAMQCVRRKINDLLEKEVKVPVVLCVDSMDQTLAEQKLHFITQAGPLLLDGFGSGIWLNNHQDLTGDFLSVPAGSTQKKDKNTFLHEVANEIKMRGLFLTGHKK